MQFFIAHLHIFAVLIIFGVSIDELQLEKKIANLTVLGKMQGLKRSPEESVSEV